MLCDVVALRAAGEKLARDVVRSATPLRGELTLDVSRPGWSRGHQKAPMQACLLPVGACTSALPPLDAARVTTIRGDSLIVIGIEEFEIGRHRTMRYRQAWWCRIVGKDRQPTERWAQPSRLLEVFGDA